MGKKMRLENLKVKSFITNLEPAKMTKLKGGDTCGSECESLEGTCEGTPCRPPDYTWWTSPCKCTNDPQICP
jgi:hypothetical protein